MLQQCFAQTDLRLEVARAFWALVTARATVVVLEQGVTRAQAHLLEVRERFKNDDAANELLSRPQRPPYVIT